MDPQVHVRGVEDNSGVGVRGRVVEELSDLGEGVFGGHCLFGSQGIEGNEERVVNGSSSEEQSAEDLLDTGTIRRR